MHFSARQQRDCWIGLYRHADYCTCSSIDDCDTCRASWSWSDGTPMSWWNWLPQEPGAATCGRLSVDGWAEYDCEANYRLICERGTFSYISLFLPDFNAKNIAQRRLFVIQQNCDLGGRSTSNKLLDVSFFFRT